MYFQSSMPYSCFTLLDFAVECKRVIRCKYSHVTFVSSRKCLLHIWGQSQLVASSMPMLLSPAAVCRADEAVIAARAKLSTLTPSPENIAFDAGKEVMERLRQQHSVLGSTMEGMLGEIGSKFVPRPLERLLAVVTALLHRSVPAESQLPMHHQRQPHPRPIQQCGGQV